jgi:hypothetical protein
VVLAVEKIRAGIVALVREGEKTRPLRVIESGHEPWKARIGGGELANSVGQPPTADAMRPHPVEKPGDLHAAIAGGCRLRVGVRMTESSEEAVVHLRSRRRMPNAIARGTVSPKAGAAKARMEEQQHRGNERRRHRKPVEAGYSSQRGNPVDVQSLLKAELLQRGRSLHGLKRPVSEAARGAPLICH